MKTRRSALWAWAQLLRPPNLFTVPGDAVVGALLATVGTASPPVGPLLGAALSVLLLYLGGLLFNDLFDIGEDRRERPDRPLPSGLVDPGSVAIAGGWCLAAGIFAAWLAGGHGSALWAVLLGLFVLAYNGGGKRHRLIGPALMASCRATSVILGASVAGAWSWPGTALLLEAAASLWAFIFFLTRVAADETSQKRPAPTALVAPSLAAALPAALVVLTVDGFNAIICWALLALAVVEGLALAARVLRRELPLPPFIGRLIRTLLTWQALWLVAALADRGLGTLLLLLTAVALARWAATRIARWFYGS